MNLYIGCASPPFHPQHTAVMQRFSGDWEYIDKYIEHPHVKNYDALDLPYGEGTIEVIYSSHLLEHLEIHEVPEVFTRWTRLLAPGGQMIINVPDLEWCCRIFLLYLDLERSGRAISGYFNESINYKNEHSLLAAIFGSQSHLGEYHKSGFTLESLSRLAQSAGLTVKKIEQKVDAHDMGVLIMEAYK